MIIISKLQNPCTCQCSFSSLLHRTILEYTVIVTFSTKFFLILVPMGYFPVRCNLFCIDDNNSSSHLHYWYWYCHSPSHDLVPSHPHGPFYPLSLCHHVLSLRQIHFHYYYCQSRSHSLVPVHPHPPHPLPCPRVPPRPLPRPRALLDLFHSHVHAPLFRVRVHPLFRFHTLSDASQRLIRCQCHNQWWWSVGLRFDWLSKWCVRTRHDSREIRTSWWVWTTSGRFVTPLTK